MIRTHSLVHFERLRILTGELYSGSSTLSTYVGDTHGALAWQEDLRKAVDENKVAQNELPLSISNILKF